MANSLPQKSRVNRDVTGAMQQRPNLAILVAQIATNWTRIEELLGRTLTQLLGAEAKSGMVMYQALSGGASRTSVLRAVARYRSAVIAAELETVLAAVRTTGGKRNDIIHGHWFYSDDHPDDLVWLASKHDLISYSEFWAGYNANPEHQKQIEFAKGFQAKRRDYRLYKEADFKSVLSEILLLGGRIVGFNVECEKLNRATDKEAG